MKTKIYNRKSLYYALNSRLAELSDEHLLTKIKKGITNEGWGENSLIKVDGRKIFVKTVPLTQKEYDNSFSTKNLFQLPLFYNYGVGSAGLGAFRELTAHIKTTNWVLSDEHSNFPLLYHYRIVPNSSGKVYTIPGDPKKYASSWNGSKNIEKYVRDRKKPAYKVVLFLEFIPFVLQDWIKSNSQQVTTFSKKVIKTLNFLKEKKIIHFDAHWGNILTDGSEPYLTDFGLLLDYKYCSNQKEKDFFNNHQHYDHAKYIGCMSWYLEDVYQSCSKKAKEKLEAEFDINNKILPRERVGLIVESFEDILKSRYMSFEKEYVSFIKKNKSIILQSNSFFNELRFKKKTIKSYKSISVKKNLEQAGVI